MSVTTNLVAASQSPLSGHIFTLPGPSVRHQTYSRVGPHPVTLTPGSSSSRSDKHCPYTSALILPGHLKQHNWASIASYIYILGTVDTHQLSSKHSASFSFSRTSSSMAGKSPTRHGQQAHRPPKSVQEGKAKSYYLLISH